MNTKRAVYIGAEPAQELAALVLQHSIAATTTGSPVEVHVLHREITAVGINIDNSLHSNTPFSKQRLFVPLLAGSGQAAYLDSDMLVFADINGLFDSAGSRAVSACPSRQAGRDAQTSVLVFDVARCHWDPRALLSEIDGDGSKYRPYLYEFAFTDGVDRCLPAEWNDLESHDNATTRLLHFTDMETQPWLTSSHRLADLWLEHLRRLVQHRPESARVLADSVRRFEVRPSLAWQANNGWPGSDDIPISQRLLDVFQFVPPHALVSGLPGGVGAALRRVFESKKVPRLVQRALMFVSSALLLGRRRRRLLVKATLTKRKCVINQNIQALVS
jgi:hypothetical protein